MKIKNGMKVVSPKGLEYKIVGIEDNKVIVSRINKSGEEVIKEFRKSTVTKTWKPAPTEDDKTLVEEALEEAGLNSKLGKIGDKVEESKEEEKEIEEAKEEEKEIITLKEILISLGIEPTADYTKTLRRKLRKNEELKALRMDGYNWSFKVESKEDVVKKLKDII